MAEDPASFAECVDTAARLLRYAENESDHDKVHDFTQLADSWVNLGAALTEREQADR